jgi:hypothetical protein
MLLYVILINQNILLIGGRGLMINVDDKIYMPVGRFLNN